MKVADYAQHSELSSRQARPFARLPDVQNSWGRHGCDCCLAVESASDRLDIREKVNDWHGDNTATQQVGKA